MMPRFITIGYGDQAGYDRTPQSARDAAHKHDAKLQSQGALMGIAGKPVQVRNPNAAGVETANGPFMSSSLPVAGFAILEAADLADAIQKVSQSPCAIAQGVVEVWPLEETPNR
ncbi:MAG TPA: transcription initiation protein [Burkholderiales bacterium]